MNLVTASLRQMVSRPAALCNLATRDPQRGDLMYSTMQSARACAYGARAISARAVRKHQRSALRQRAYGTSGLRCHRPQRLGLAVRHSDFIMSVSCGERAKLGGTGVLSTCRCISKIFLLRTRAAHKPSERSRER